MGADHVVDHRAPLAPQLETLGFEHVDAALNFADTDAYWETLGELLAPQGHVGLIVEPAGALKIGDPYKFKCIGIHWEMMFGRPRFRTPGVRTFEMMLVCSRAPAWASLMPACETGSREPKFLCLR